MRVRQFYIREGRKVFQGLFTYQRWSRNRKLGHRSNVAKLVFELCIDLLLRSAVRLYWSVWRPFTVSTVNGVFLPWMFILLRRLVVQSVASLHWSRTASVLNCFPAAITVTATIGKAIDFLLHAHIAVAAGTSGFLSVCRSVLCLLWHSRHRSLRVQNRTLCPSFRQLKHRLFSLTNSSRFQRWVP